jgi:F-type H+-transporting ATPase subunit epsilon
MKLLQCDIVTAERRVYAGEATEVVAPAADGQVAILPRHAPLLSSLLPGEVRLVRPGQDDLILVVGGGFMEVRDDKVVILADSAERADEIDVERARQARERAERLLHAEAGQVDFAKAEAALRRSLARLQVAERVKTRSGRPSSGSGPGN